MGGARKRSAAGGMERSGSLCGRGCRSAGADASATWKSLPLQGSRSGIIEKQLPAEKPHGSIGKQLHSAKHGTTGSNCRQGSRKAPSGSSSTVQSKAPSRRATCRTSTIGTSNLPNRQHREEHFLANNGAKWAGVEGVRGRNLACFLKNFVSNYIVIFLMMLFRVHL